VPTLPCTKCGYAAPAAPGEAPAASGVGAEAQNGPVIDTAADVYALVAKDLQTEAQEHALLVLLDVHRRVLAPPDGVVLLAKGSAVETLVPIEAIVREVCARNARSFVLCHSHPSGKATPSNADKSLTRQVEGAFSKKTGLDVVFIDHLVIGKGEYFSFAEGKKIDSASKVKANPIEHEKFIRIVSMDHESARKWAIDFFGIPEDQIKLVEDAGPAKPADKYKEGAREFHIYLYPAKKKWWGGKLYRVKNA
jgi:hypothetical protein